MLEEVDAKHLLFLWGRETAKQHWPWFNIDVWYVEMVLDEEDGNDAIFFCDMKIKKGQI